MGDARWEISEASEDDNVLLVVESPWEKGGVDCVRLDDEWPKLGELHTSRASFSSCSSAAIRFLRVATTANGSVSGRFTNFRALAGGRAGGGRATGTLSQ